MGETVDWFALGLVVEDGLEVADIDWVFDGDDVFEMVERLLFAPELTRGVPLRDIVLQGHGWLGG